METIIYDKIDIACSQFKRIRDSQVEKFNKLDEWLEKESKIFSKEIKRENRYKRYPNFKRGQRVFNLKIKYICSSDILNKLDKAIIDYLTNYR